MYLGALIGLPHIRAVTLAFTRFRLRRCRQILPPLYMTHQKMPPIVTNNNVTFSRVVFILLRIVTLNVFEQ